jgi:hypothetical protein
MGRKATKQMNFVSEITENWIKTSYPTAAKQDCWNYKNRMNMISPEQATEIAKRTKYIFGKMIGEQFATCV